MSATLDQALLMKLVEHPNEGDRLYIEPSRDLGLADAFVSCNVEHDCRLLPRDRQPHLPRTALEPPLDQPRDVMDEKAESATDAGLHRSSLRLRQCHGMRGVIRRHDGSPQKLVAGHPKAPPALATA